MYKAVHVPSNQEIIILSRLWAGQEEFLRSLGQADQLVCPSCRQPVQARLGDIRIWHFAHKHALNCPFESESPVLLQARARLYDWLLQYFPEEQVEIEKNFAHEMRRPLDCFLKPAGTGFWVFDRRMPPDEREKLIKAVAKAEIKVNWLFTADMLHIEPDRPERLYLTTTEREFLQVSAMDLAWQKQPLTGAGKTLHYLDGDRGLLVTYRNVHLLHEPQLFRGQRLESQLAEVQFSAVGQEFVHPGELAQLAWQQQELALRQQKEQARLQRAEEKLQKLIGKPGKQSGAAEPPAWDERERFASKAGTCRGCGKLTTDWVSFFGNTNECICRSCDDQRQG